MRLEETSGDSLIQLLIYSIFSICDRGDYTVCLSNLFQCLTSLMLKKTEGEGGKFVFVLCLTNFLYFSLCFLSFH